MKACVTCLVLLLALPARAAVPTPQDVKAAWRPSDATLLDGTTSVRMPFERITDAAGKDMEMHPRPVDVMVKRPVGESYTGRDSQLDAAVAELLKRVGEKP